MADTVLEVETRQRTGTGGARDTRRSGYVPGVIYGGKGKPAAVAVSANTFRKALYAGKLLGHLVRLQEGGRRQAVIVKDIQFHPVTDQPVHFDFYRVDEHQTIAIKVAVHFINEELSPGIKRGGTLNINLHELELMAPADSIPEQLTVDLTGLDIGDVIAAADVPLPAGVELSAHDKEATVASVATSSAMQAEDADLAAEAEATAEEAAEEGEAEAGEASEESSGSEE